MPIRQELSGIIYTDQVFDALSGSLSVPRLDVYLRAAGFDKPRALELYIWNAQISEDFQFPIHIAEVAVRNTINRAFQDRFTTMWNKCECFLAMLSEDGITDLQKVEKRLYRRYGDFSNGQLVAALPFGFWVSLLEPRYHREVWRPRLRRCFPGLPASRGRKSIHTNCRSIVELRNRIAHHEPLLKLDLSIIHSQIIDTITWVCGETAAWVRAHSGVQATIRKRP